MSERKFETRGLKREFAMPFTNDVVHRSIKLCPLSKRLMSTPQMQRLKQLKQLGVSDILYTCTTHNRFQHSLGVMALAEQLLRGIKERQPRLGITEKDVACVKLAGLLHDVGHGPYSHVYDGLFRKQLRMAEARGEWLGQKIDTSSYDEFPNAMEGWAHEDASLMMIDDMLKELGLEIDESNLDAPLRQIGDGVDARRFGIWDRSSECDAIAIANDDSDDDSDFDDGDGDDFDLPPLPAELVLTSRDWIFIKECISGGPLPPKGMSIDKFKESSTISKLVGRPDPHKEFLYDVVSNRHSGLDVDKMDYLARDILQAHAANIADLLPKLSEKAFVAWGECSDQSKCWKCKQNGKRGKRCVEGERPGMHTMICYPDSMVQNAMSFFEKRYEEHSRLYTHGKTTAGNYMVCDILLLAEPHFRILATDDGEDAFSPPPNDVDDNVAGAKHMKLSISRAMADPRTYLMLTDNVLDQIMNTDEPELRPARMLIKRFRSHEIYKRIRAPQNVIGDAAWEKKLWGMKESEIVEEILRLSEADMDDEDDAAKTLKEDDIIIEKRTIHHGMKDKNPVNFMRFLPKELHRRLLNAPEHLPTARQIPEASYRKPDVFLQRTVRVYCRSVDGARQRRLGRCYGEFVRRLQESENEERYSATFEYCEDLPVTPPRASAPAVSQTPLSVSQSPNGYDDASPPRSKRRRRDRSGEALFYRVTKGDGHR